MKTEFEAKFVQVDIDKIRDTLQSSGAVLEQPMRLMRRVVIETPELRKKDAFVRVRDEGHQTTLTYKQFDSISIDGAKEFEVVVSDFWETVQLLEVAGLPYRSYQESKRETWRLGEGEVVLDVWPWLDPYVEIEGQDEMHVRSMSAQLGFDWKNAVFGGVMSAYCVQYPHLTADDTVAHLPKVAFDDPLPDLLKDTVR